jgi:hypothetical protein
MNSGREDAIEERGVQIPRTFNRLLPLCSHSGEGKIMSKFDFKYFTRVPDAIYDARREGFITPLMHDILSLYHKWASRDDGSVQSVSAGRILTWLGERYDDGKLPSERTIQRHQQALFEAGWFLSDYRQGQKRPYNIVLTNYLPVNREDADRDSEQNLLNPKELRHWEETSVFRGGDHHVQGTSKGRAKGAQGAAKDQTLVQTFSETLDKNVDKTVATDHDPASHLIQNISKNQSQNRPRERQGQTTLPGEEGIRERAVALGLTALADYVLSMPKHRKFLLSSRNPAKAFETQALAGAWDREFEKQIPINRVHSTKKVRFMNDDTEKELPPEVRYLDGEIDTTEPEPETVADVAARVQPFTVYSGVETVAVVDAYQQKQPALMVYLPNQLWTFYDGKQWHIHADRQKLEDKCLLLGMQSNVEKPKFIMEDV